MEKEQAKRTALSLHLLDVEGRRYRYGEFAEETYKKAYTYMDLNRRLLGFAEDMLGTISDCYILYAIAILGVADKQTIQLFLKNLKARNPDLLIENMDDENGFKSRLRILKKYGFIFSITYEYWDYSDKDAPAHYPITLHTIDPEACNLVNEKLSKRIPYNKWLQAKQLPELIGWGSATYVGTSISFHKNFKMYLDGAFRNRWLGTFYFPCELKYYAADKYHYVAVLDAFLIHNTRTQSEDDYREVCVLKINAIKNYLAARTKKGIAHVVVSVADKDDLYAMMDLILRTAVLLEYLPYIYFTGEGILQNTPLIENAFLQLVAPYDDVSNAQFIATIPQFLR